MSYALNMIQADAAERCKKWKEAASFYNVVLHIFLFEAMLSVTDPQVRNVMERRAHCYRQSRRVLV